MGFLTPTIEGALTYLLDNTFVCEQTPRAWKSFSINRVTEKPERRLFDCTWENHLLLL